MKKTVLKNIIATLFGRKYWANIVETRGGGKTEICSSIFATKEAAAEHRKQIASTITFAFVETVSFRSRRIILETTVKS